MVIGNEILGLLNWLGFYAEISPTLNTVVSFSCSFIAALVSLSWFALLPKRKLPLSALGKDTLLPYLLHMPLNYSVGKWFAIRHTL